MKLGCDPEIFLADAAGGLKSAIDRIGGSKLDPRPLPLGDGYAVQEDNVAIEFNIPPADSRGVFVSSINKVKEYLAQEISKQDLYFNLQSAVSFPASELCHPAAHEFGCEPDFNAWTGGGINRKPSAEDKNLRSAGGHIHIGHDFASAEDVVEFMKYMDLYVGVPSVLMDNGELRKQLYGKAGAFRYKPYGGEYRTLSNFWIFEDRLIEWAWNSTQQAMDAWQNKTVDVDMLSGSIINCINNNNKQDAAQLCGRLNLTLSLE